MVPPLIGLSLEAAVRELSRARLNAKTRVFRLDGVFPEQAKAFKVTGQQPGARTQVQEGFAVYLETDLPRNVAVPQLVGLSVSEAYQLLKKSYLSGVCGDMGMQNAKVLRQDKPAGSQVPPFEVITFYARPPLFGNRK